MKLTIPEKRKESKEFELSDSPIAGLPIGEVEAEYFKIKAVIGRSWNDQILERMNRRLLECRDRFAEEYLKK